MAGEFDVLVIGGGPGGYVAALRAAQLGLRTALVEREHLGGICLNWGCIPTKSLLHAADTLRRIRGADALGIAVAEPSVDFVRVMDRSRAVAQRLNRGVAHLLRKAGVAVLEGHAAFEADRAVRVRLADGNEERLQARHTIIATGARAKTLAQLPFDGERVWSYRDALCARELPRSLIVVGAGAIGMEFAASTPRSEPGSRSSRPSRGCCPAVTPKCRSSSARPSPATVSNCAPARACEEQKSIRQACG